MPTSHHYLNHLTVVSKKNKVLIAEDIYNEKGVLVVARGVEIDQSVAQKIAKHKLAKPVEHSIALSQTLSQKNTYRMYTNRLESNGLLESSKQSGLLQDAAFVLPLLNLYPLVAEKVTVLAMRFPQVFGRAITTGVLSASIAREMKLPNESIENVFLASMLANVGLLHINPELAEKKGTYSQDELNMFQGHVAISTHFADMVPDLPKMVRRIILEHHERADGFGYPFGKSFSALGLEGQILAMADKAGAIFTKLVISGHHSLGIMFSVLSIRSSANPKDVHKAMLRVIKKGTLTYKPRFSFAQMAEVVTQCLEKRERLNLWYQEYSKTYEQHFGGVVDSSSFKPWALLEQLQDTIEESGVLSVAQQEWLTELSQNANEQDIREIEEFSLLLDDVEEQCFFVMQKLFESQDQIEKIFNDTDLPDLYYQGLMMILESD
ncbi:MAG: hypothetical protein JKY14_00420 [Paraglaciecola sp.]|nr:hypothetical protein [Paraglaciecola sp.]